MAESLDEGVLYNSVKTKFKLKHLSNVKPVPLSNVISTTLTPAALRTWQIQLINEENIYKKSSRTAQTQMWFLSKHFFYSHSWIGCRDDSTFRGRMPGMGRIETRLGLETVSRRILLPWSWTLMSWSRYKITAGCPSCSPTNSIKAPKDHKQTIHTTKYKIQNSQYDD